MSTSSILFISADPHAMDRLEASLIIECQNNGDNLNVILLSCSNKNKNNFFYLALEK